MMSQQSCFHFLFVSGIERTGSAFMTAPNKKCPRKNARAAFIL
jgi:hypothetical protein